MSDQKAEAFVVVGCKLPHGLVARVKARDGSSREFIFNGNNASRIVGGYGLTEGIPADFMTEFLKQNARHPAVVNQLVFVHSDSKSAEAIAKERRGITSGFEPLDPIAGNVMKDQDGDTDKSALAQYEAAKRNNPDRNRQRVE